MRPDHCERHDSARVEQRQGPAAPAPGRARRLAEPGKSEVDRAEREQSPACGADLDVQVPRQGGDADCDEYREYAKQPDIVEQMYPRVLPCRQRQELSAGRVPSHGETRIAAVLTGLEPKLLSSRWGCEATFAPSGAWKSSTCSAYARARTTWLWLRVGESPSTSIPLNLGSMMTLPT